MSATVFFSVTLMGLSQSVVKLALVFPVKVDVDELDIEIHGEFASCFEILLLLLLHVLSHLAVGSTRVSLKKPDLNG